MRPALIPSYASVIAAVRLRSRRRQEALVPAGAGPPAGALETTGRGVAFRAGLAFVAGFSTVFVALGVLVNRAGAALSDNRSGWPAAAGWC